MNEYKIPVTWQMISDLPIRANSLKEALQKAEQIVSKEEIPKGSYVKHSLEIQKDFIEEEYN